MSIRALLSFFLTLFFLRVAGIRTFGNKTAFETVIIIMLGSVMSRVIVGASPFVPTSVACLVFVLVHRLLGLLSYQTHIVGSLVKGKQVLVYERNMFLEKNMKKAAISEKDLQEAIRLGIHSEEMENIERIFLERTGEISIIIKKSKHS